MKAAFLIDNMAMQKGIIGKKAADFALVTYAGHLLLDEHQAQELIMLLDERYKVKSQRWRRVCNDTKSDRERFGCG